MSKRIIFIFVSLLLALFLASCTDKAADTGSGEDTQQETQEDTQQDNSSQEQQVAVMIEPEQLISKQEAQDILGVMVDEGEKTQMESSGQKTLYYDVQEGDIGFLQISLTQPATRPQGSTITPEELYQSAKVGLDDTSDADISGIGDECFTGTPGLHIVSDGYYIVIAAGNSDNTAVQEVLKKAGELAVGNLKALISG